MPPNQPFLQVMLRWPHLHVLGAWKSRMSHMPAYFFSKDLKPTNLCSSFLWSPRYDHAWKSPGGLGYLSGSITSFVMWEAEVPLYAPFFLLKLFPFSLWLALVLSKPITYLSIMFFSSFLFSSFQSLSLVTVWPFPSNLSVFPCFLLFYEQVANETGRHTELYTRQVEIAFLQIQKSSWYCSARCGVPGVLTEETFHLTLSRVWSWMNHIIKTLTHRLQLLMEHSVVQERPQPADPLELIPLLFFFPPHTPDLAMWHFGHRIAKESQRHRTEAAFQDNLALFSSAHDKVYLRRNLQINSSLKDWHHFFSGPRNSPGWKTNEIGILHCKLSTDNFSFLVGGWMQLYRTVAISWGCF